MSLAMTQILTLLKEHHLLQSVTNYEPTATFTSVTYDSRQAQPDSLFFCKGNFKASYLTKANQQGATAYVAEIAYEQGQGMVAILVSNVQKAMALIGAAFYDYPQNDLFIIGFTGTKGKTTSSYFAHGILQAATKGHAALFSTIDRVLGPKPKDRFKSHLTTPESLDLFHDMRVAVDNHMTHLVMEVSSQAYKKDRVYGLKYDVGVFLNISPDHIGRNEHPTFEDYLLCKEQVLVNSRICLINAETKHLKEITYAAQTTTEPDKIYYFARQGALPKHQLDLDVTFENQAETMHQSDFTIKGVSQKGQALKVDGRYQLHLPGDYNEVNAVSAIMATALAEDIDTDQVTKALAEVQVPGRMEIIQSGNHGTIYIDYAHNYASLKALLSFLHQQTSAGKVIVVVGSTGDKGESRREGFGRALSEEADVAILTTDDPGFEDPVLIAREIDRHIDHDRVHVDFVMDRAEAIRTAIRQSGAQDIVVLAGKGEDNYQIINGVDTPYDTDVTIAKNVVKELS